MAVYKYYSLIHQEDGAFIVSFPDLESCYSQGDTLPEAVTMAEDVLGTMLSYYEDNEQSFPAPSKVDAIHIPEGASLVFITVDTDNFRETV